MNILINMAAGLEEKYADRLKKAKDNLREFPEMSDLISGRKQAYEDILADIKRFKEEVEKWLLLNATE